MKPSSHKRLYRPSLIHSDDRWLSFEPDLVSASRATDHPRWPIASGDPQCDESDQTAQLHMIRKFGPLISRRGRAPARSRRPRRAFVEELMQVRITAAVARQRRLITRA